MGSFKSEIKEGRRREKSENKAKQTSLGYTHVVRCYPLHGVHQSFTAVVKKQAETHTPHMGKQKE